MSLCTFQSEVISISKANNNVTNFEHLSFKISNHVDYCEEVTRRLIIADRSQTELSLWLNTDRQMKVKF